MNCHRQTSEGVDFQKVKKQNLLGILIDRSLRFDEYILSQCKKAGRKLTVLIRNWILKTIGSRRVFG